MFPIVIQGTNACRPDLASSENTVAEMGNLTFTLLC